MDQLVEFAKKEEQCLKHKNYDLEKEIKTLQNDIDILYKDYSKTEEEISINTDICTNINLTRSELASRITTNYKEFLTKTGDEKLKQINSLKDKLYFIELEKQSKINKIQDIKNNVIINQNYMIILKSYQDRSLL